MLAPLDRAADELNMGVLSGRLMVSAGNVTGLVNRLAEEGLVETARVPEDRRTQIVRLTSKGKQAFDRMAPAHEGWIDAMLSALTPGEAEALYGLLGKVQRFVLREGEGDGD